MRFSQLSCFQYDARSRLIYQVFRLLDCFDKDFWLRWNLKSFGPNLVPNFKSGKTRMSHEAFEIHARPLAVSLYF